jgi:hypothetical protein
VTPRILTLLSVTLLSACGVGAHSAPREATRVVGFQATTSDLAAAEVAASNAERSTADDYVVGPIIEPTGDGRPGVPTYYIVRN